MSSKKVTVRGKTYDLADLADIVSIQGALVPDNWPTKKADCVNLFLSVQNMLGMEFKRHLAANWKQICKAAQEEGADGNPARLAVAFNFELDQSAPTVAAFTKTAMSFSVKHGTKGKPRTHDLAQGEFLDEDMSVVFDVKGFEKENAPEEKPEKEPKADDAPPDPESPAPVGTFPGETPAAVDKPKRKRKKS